MHPLGAKLAVSLTLAFSLAATGRAQDPPLNLERAIELALTRNERVPAEDQRVEAARARVARARAFFFPDLTVTGNYTRRQSESIRRIDNEDVTIQSLNALSATALLGATLFNARAFPLYRQARFDLEGVRLTAEDQKLQLAFEAAEAFVITLNDEQVLRAAGRRLEFAKTTLADAVARFDAGLVSSNDVTKVELEIATAERELARAEGSAAAARLQLENLLDTVIDGPLQVPEEIIATALSTATPDAQGISAALSMRLDLRASRERIRALRAFAVEPSRRIFPSLGLTGQYRSTNEGGISGRNNDGSLGLNLTWSLYDGGEWLAERAERKAQVRVAEFELENAEREAETEMQEAAVTLGSDRKSIEQAVRASKLARKNAEETGELYRQGLATALEVADANVRGFEADVAESRARYQLVLSYLGLRLASGKRPL